MKKKYLDPEMDITEFDVKDIITTSNGEESGNGDEGSNEGTGSENG